MIDDVVIPGDVVTILIVVVLILLAAYLVRRL